MMQFLTLIRRELWEHNNLWRLPAILIVLALLANVAFSGSIKWLTDLLAVSPSSVTSQVLDGTLRSISLAVFIIFSFMSIIYLMDCLHAERKDKSILFWRSLPVSDTATVLSKLTVAVIIIPLATWVCVVIVQLISLLIQSLVSDGGNLFKSLVMSELVFYWLNLLLVLALTTLWTLPLLAWILFCSSWTKRTPFLAAVIIPVIAILIEKTFELNMGLSTLIGERLPFGRSLFNVFGENDLIQSATIAAGVGQIKLGIQDYQAYLTQPAMWIGWIVAGVLVTAAIWVRRWRDDA